MNYIGAVEYCFNDGTDIDNFVSADNAKSIGNSSSGATYDSDDYKGLWDKLWSYASKNVAVTTKGIVLTDSSGNQVASEGSAQDDWDADYRLRMNLNGVIPVGYSSVEAQFDTCGKTGGAKSQSIDADNLPTHTHAGSGNTGSGSSHTHPFSATTGGESNSHTHAPPAGITGFWGYTGSANSPSGSVRTLDSPFGATGPNSLNHSHSVSGTTNPESTHYHPNTATGNNTTNHDNLDVLNPYITLRVYIRYKLDGAVSGDVSA